MKKKIIGFSAGLLVSLLVAGSAFAANPPGTGQPGAPVVSCGSGSATEQPNGFSSAGFALAETVYAGSDGTHSQLNANSSHAIAQYDVACLQQTANH